MFRKHRTTLTKLQEKKEEERLRERLRHLPFWLRWTQAKRLRGLLPDQFKGLVADAEERGDENFLRLYVRRFQDVEEAQRHW